MNNTTQPVPYCDIDSCFNQPTTTLTVQLQDTALSLGFCQYHVDALEARLATQLGMMRHQVDMRKMPLPGVVGDLQDAIQYLDDLANAKAYDAS